MESDAMEEEDGRQEKENGPRAASVFTRKLSRRAPSVRETVDGPPEIEDDFGQYRMQVTTMIRYIFETEVEVNSFISPKNQAVKKFIQLVKKIKKTHPKDYETIIKEECRVRMNYMVEEVSHYDSRYRVMIFFVLAGLRLYYDHDEDFILQLMLDYAILSSNAESSNVRANCLRICSRMLMHWLIEPIGKDEKKHMEPAVRDQIYGNLRYRQQDKVVQVRHACVLAIAEIQDMEISNNFKMGMQCSPKDMLFRACQDLNPQVQLAAITSVDLAHCAEYHIDKLMGLACGAPETSMKQEAVKRLGQMQLNRFNTEKLLDTLQAILEDGEEEVAETAKRYMLTEWLVRLAMTIAKDNGHPTGRRNDGDSQSGEPLLGVASAILCFLNQMDCTKWNKKRDIIVFALLDCARWIICPKKKRLNIAELAVHLVTDKCTPMIWSRYNKEAVFKDRLDHSSIALHLYLWRCMVQYCDRETAPGMPEDDDALRDECYQRLLCPLASMVDILEAVWRRDELDTYDRLPLLPEDELAYMGSIAEAIKLCNFTPADPHGKKKCLDLLTEISLNPNNHIFLTNLIGSSILNILHSDERDDSADPSKCPCQIHLEMLLDRSRFFVALNREVDENNRDEMSQQERTAIVAYAVQAIYGMMSNNRFHTNYHFMERLLIRLMHNEDARAHEKTRGLVIKCVTIWMMSSEPIARKYYPWLEGCSKKSETSKNKGIAINCLYDLYHHFGRDKYESWRRGTGHDRSWITDMGFFLFNYGQKPGAVVDEEFFLANCEVACEFMLNDEKNPDPSTGELSIITGMCEQYFQPYGIKSRRFRQMFLQFAMLYIQQSRTNMVRFAYGLLSTISAMLKNYSATGEAEIAKGKRVTLGDLELVITAAAAWCRDDVPLAEEETNELKASYLKKYEVNSLFIQFFMRRIIDYIENDGMMDICMRVISAQDPSKVPEAHITPIQQTLMDVFEHVDEHYGPKHYYRQVLTRLQHELDKNFEMDIKQEVDDGYSDGPPVVPRIIKKKNPVPTKPRKFISVQKYRNIKKVVEFEDRGLNPGPEEAPTSSRAHLARNVRRKNFDLETLDEDE